MLIMFNGKLDEILSSDTNCTLLESLTLTFICSELDFCEDAIDGVVLTSLSVGSTHSNMFTIDFPSSFQEVLRIKENRNPIWGPSLYMGTIYSSCIVFPHCKYAISNSLPFTPVMESYT